MKARYTVRQAKQKADCVFRSNHVFNRLVLRGTLPYDREAMLLHVENAIAQE